MFVVLDRARVWLMVHRISWFRPADYAILRFYDDHDIYISAKGLARNLDYSRQYVNRRLNVLADAGLLARDDGLYALSDRGRAFLAGGLDLADVENGP